MSIMTKMGDNGRTSLLLGGMVDKDDPRIEFIGVLDELTSFIGMAKSIVKSKPIKEYLELIQRDLFYIGTEVVTSPKFLKKLKKRIDKKDISRLEKSIEKLEKKSSCKKFCFCLPGKNFISSVLDVSRTIARSAERKAHTLLKKKILRNHSILVYLNRLSDILYLLARASER